MNIVRPDIIVTDPEGEYLIVVEVKYGDRISDASAIEQLRRLMASMGCSIGLAVVGGQSNSRIALLRDSFEKDNGESIDVVARATLPDSLLPPLEEKWRGSREIELVSRVQSWLEKLKLSSNSEDLPKDLKEVLKEPVLNLLRIGEIRAGYLRWSSATMSRAVS